MALFDFAPWRSVKLTFELERCHRHLRRVVGCRGETPFHENSLIGISHQEAHLLVV